MSQEYEITLCHWAKGSTAKDHKWIERTGTSGHYKYTYKDDKSKNNKQSSGSSNSDSSDSSNGLNFMSEDWLNDFIQRGTSNLEAKGSEIEADLTGITDVKSAVSLVRTNFSQMTVKEIYDAVRTADSSKTPEQIVRRQVGTNKSNAYIETQVMASVGKQKVNAIAQQKISEIQNGLNQGYQKVETVVQGFNSWLSNSLRRH